MQCIVSVRPSWYRPECELVREREMLNWQQASVKFCNQATSRESSLLWSVKLESKVWHTLYSRKKNGKKRICGRAEEYRIVKPCTVHVCPITDLSQHGREWFITAFLPQCIRVCFSHETQLLTAPPAPHSINLSRHMSPCTLSRFTASSPTECPLTRCHPST